MKLCECGCGTPVYSRFVHNHHNRIPVYKERIAAANRARAGDKHPRWTGDEVSYNAVHRWLRKRYPLTGVCQSCGKRPYLSTELHSTTGEYTRNLDEYVEICRDCHNKLKRVR